MIWKKELLTNNLIINKMNLKKILSKLISYATISEKSNLELATFIINFLKKNGVNAQKIQGEKGRFNVFCKIGPETEGGIVLSGHMDVVPVQGQKWTHNPFKMTEKNGKFFGRGSADMKGFIAVVLSLIKKIKVSKMQKPLFLIFSYDEEIGCLGIQKLVPFLKKLDPKPKFCIVGEPTEMKIVNQHKGKKNYFVEFHGIEAHSSLIDDGVNAIKFCSQFINFLERKQMSIKKDIDLNFNPNFTTINVGKILGGTAVNIIPNNCKLEFEVRDTPRFKNEKFINQVKEYLLRLETEMKSMNSKCFIEFNEQNNFPPLKTEEDSEIISFSSKLLRTNSINSVSFGTEAGIFSQLGFETIVCGPGSIRQAHKPDEYIELNQLQKCEDFLMKVISKLY